MLVVDSGGVLLHPHQGANLNSGCQYKDAVGAIVYIFESRMSAAEKKRFFWSKVFKKCYLMLFRITRKINMIDLNF